MGIKYFKKRKIFHLYSKSFSYYIGINKLGYLIHLYSGNYLDDIGIERTNERYMERYSFLDSNLNKEIQDEDYYFSIIASQFECASFGKGDKRNYFARFEREDGIDITNFIFKDYKLVKGPVFPTDLPHPRFKDNEASTLIVVLKDEFSDVILELYYVISEKYEVLARFSKIYNNSNEKIVLKRLASFELDLNNNNYDILAMHGTWSNDRQAEKIPLNHSITKISDNHGSRGFNYNPSIALVNKEANLDNGEVIGLSLMYSGDFSYEINVDEIDQTRIICGINDENFEYNLEPNEYFVTPIGLITFSNLGMNKISQTFHKLCKERIIPNYDKFRNRPILLNSWEACTFDFNTNKIINFIDQAKKLDIEMVVIDDGWFGNRNDDTSSLGDWNVNEKKVDLKKIVDYCHSINMKIGLWVEPEMISPNSNLFKEHPEFSLYPKTYKNPTLFRHQLVLDLVNKNARDYVFNELTNIFDNLKFDYVKWDFNRFLTEGYSETLNKNSKLETYHKFVLGTYDLLNRFITRYPDILLETCASGGGRFDFGMLYYSPQIWCSDETDITQRVNIQYATNLFYPLSSIGAHVSNRKIGTIQDKAILAFFGTYGYELDITTLNKEDKNKIKEFNKLYKEHHQVINDGIYYSLSDPFISNYASFMAITENRKEAILFFFNYRKETTKSRFIKLKGLDESKYYFNSLTNDIYKGSFYMNIGINLSAPLDAFTTALVVLKEVDPIKTSIYKAMVQNKPQKRTKLL